MAEKAHIKGNATAIANLVREITLLIAVTSVVVLAVL